MLCHVLSHVVLCVFRVCPQGSRSRSGAVFTIGVVGRCLSKTMIEGKKLEPKCKDLVLVAAPKDARAYFDTSESRNTVVQMVSTSTRTHTTTHTAGFSPRSLVLPPTQRNA